MKRVFALAVLLALAAPVLHSANASVPDLVGTLTATTSVNNSTTAVPFPLASISVIAVQCDAAARIKQGTTSSTAATSTSLLINAGETKYFDIRTGGKFLAAINATGGTSNCYVYKVY